MTNKCPKCWSENIIKHWKNRIRCKDCGRSSVLGGWTHGWARIYPKKRILLQYIDSPVKAGFPSPAMDYEEKTIDLYDVLMPHPDSCFIFKIDGDSMMDAQIFDGDYIIVDKAVTPKIGDIVLAHIDGNFTCKELKKNNNGYYLYAHNPSYPPIYPREGEELQIWWKVCGKFNKVS